MAKQKNKGGRGSTWKDTRWDVTNLYTIIPLRASASETLTEQTIGRGLRLPYGQRTGMDEVDRLSIVSHERYEAIVKQYDEYTKQ